MKPSRKIILWIYVIFLIIFGYQLATTQPLEKPTSVRIVANANSFTLPNTPIISLVNESENTVTVDTCRDIKVTANGLNQTTLPSAFCRMVEVPPNDAKTPTALFGHTKEDIVVYQTNFGEIPEAHLEFTFAVEGLETSKVTTKIQHAGWIRLFFRTIFYNPVYNLFAALILLFPGYSLGWAIVAITLIIRLALLIPQQHMMVSQRKMQILQPKIKAIQDAHKGDQAAIGMKMMELYKKEGVNPLGSCLPILVQIPILIVLYQVISHISNPANLSHLYDFTWLQNFRNISLNTIFFGLHLEKSGGVVGIILGLATGGLQFGQMWLSQKKMRDNKKDVPETPKEPKIEGMPDMQKMQKTMMYIFPIMAAYFTYILPAGLGLYWLIGTLFMIVQQYIANKQVEKKKMIIRDIAGKIVN